MRLMPGLSTASTSSGSSSSYLTRIPRVSPLRLLRGYTLSYTGPSFIQAIGTRVQRPATGTFAGLSAFVQRWRIASTATEANTGAKGMVTIDVEDQLIPIFQFGVFYDHDLEMLPGRQYDL